MSDKGQPKHGLRVGDKVRYRRGTKYAGLECIVIALVYEQLVKLRAVEDRPELAFLLSPHTELEKIC